MYLFMMHDIVDAMSECDLCECTLLRMYIMWSGVVRCI